MAKGSLRDRSREPTVPQITSLDQIETILPRYVWVDEDDNQVSPIHKELRSAFNFVNGWDEKIERFKREMGDEDLGFDDIAADPGRRMSYQKLTRSGKPPVKLKRVSIEVTVNEATEEEKTLAGVMLGRK